MAPETKRIDLKAELAGFSGSTMFYRHPLGVVYTEGVKHLADVAGAYWLIDLIASHQPKIKGEGFQVWQIKLDGEGGATVSAWSDVPGKSKCLVKQVVSYTDFPEDFELYAVGNELGTHTLLLKSEY